MTKHLTDAELAAEWHRQDSTFILMAEGYGVETFGSDYALGSAQEVRAASQRDTLHRFAVAAHYDEP